MRVALEYLRIRSRFAVEVRAQLESKGFDEDDVEFVMRDLLVRRLIDDRRTVDEIVERNVGKRTQGRDALRAGLEVRGAPPEVVDHALASIPHSEAERAGQALRAHFSTVTDRAKMGRFLMARGFEDEAIEAALDRYST